MTPNDRVLRATSLSRQPLMNPGTHRIGCLLRCGGGGVEQVAAFHLHVRLPSPVPPPPVEAALPGDECVIASAPRGSIAKAALQLRIVACQRQIVDRLDAIAIRRRFEMAGLDGSAEQNRLASLMDMQDEAEPEIPVLLRVLVDEAPESGKEDVTLQYDDFRKCVKQELAYRRFSSPARAGDDKQWEPADPGAMGASRAGDDRPPGSITPDRTIRAERATPLADLPHRRAPPSAKPISRR